MMNDPEFDKLLQRLHDEIQQTHNVGQKEKELLQDIRNDIRDLLERQSKDQAVVEPLTLKRLEESIELLEISHPTLTNLMNQLLAILNNSGI